MAKRARTERRKAARETVKVARARMRLASMEAGGAPDKAIEVSSASLVEPQAASMACVACGEVVRVEEHIAVTHTDDAGMARRLRVAKVRCSQCGVRRDIYFRIGTTLAN